MNIEDQRRVHKRNPFIDAADIETGACFEGRIGTHHDTFMVISTAVLSLSNPSWQWKMPVVIEDYQPLNVKLVIKGDA